MQIGQSVFQSDFCATPSGRPAMLCYLCSTQFSGWHISFVLLRTRLKGLPPLDEVMKPTCHFQAGFTDVYMLHLTFSSLSLWTARRVILHWILFCMPVYMYFYTFDFNGIFNGNYF